MSKFPWTCKNPIWEYWTNGNKKVELIDQIINNNKNKLDWRRIPLIVLWKIQTKDSLSLQLFGAGIETYLQKFGTLNFSNKMIKYHHIWEWFFCVETHSLMISFWFLWVKHLFIVILFIIYALFYFIVIKVGKMKEIPNHHVFVVLFRHFFLSAFSWIKNKLHLEPTSIKQNQLERRSSKSNQKNEIK